MSDIPSPNPLPDLPEDIHPQVRALMRWFDHAHLPPSLQAVVSYYRATAVQLVHHVGAAGGPELTVALRKLLESKDAAVRAAIAAAET